jgi:hypothetical protein
MLDLDAFIERAAIIEFDAGMSRFEAETLSARLQGYERHEVVNEIRRRNSGQARHSGPADGGQSAHDLPRVQPHPTQETRSMSERDVQAGRAGVDVLALRLERG